MRKHYFALFTVLLVSGVLLTAFGLYLKTDLPAEYDIYRGENPIALPFVLFADGKLLDALDVEESSSTTVSGIYPEVQPETTQPSRETKPLETTQITMEIPPIITVVPMLYNQFGSNTLATATHTQLIEFTIKVITTHARKYHIA